VILYNTKYLKRSYHIIATDPLTDIKIIGRNAIVWIKTKNNITVFSDR
jgi:hypothetical protein